MNELQTLSLRTVDFSKEILDENTGHIIKLDLNDIYVQDNLINHFPVVHDSKGILWSDGILFLMHYANTYSSKGLPEASSISNMANAIKIYKNWATENNINIYHFEVPRNKRPTYQYGYHLKYLIDSGNIKSSTAVDRFNKVKAFYNWVANNTITRKNFNKEFKPGLLWKTIKGKINYTSGTGFFKSKEIEITDISKSLYVPQNKQAFLDKKIEDGGNLKPLSIKEQSILSDELLKRGNIEMSLSHKIAIETGARLGTVCTLRSSDFLDELAPEQKRFKLRVGAGTDIKNKNMKPHELIFSSDLYYKIRSYVHSQRYKIRLNKCKLKFDYLVKEFVTNSNRVFEPKPYLFIASSGQPYYIHSRICIYAKHFNTPPTGNSINQFTISICSKTGLTYKFHDLRATCGMNLIWKFQKKLLNGKVTYLDLLTHVKNILGHESTQTTELYLNYDKKRLLHEEAQDSHEKNMKKVIERNEHEL